MGIVLYSGPKEHIGVLKEILSSRYDVRHVEPSVESLMPEFKKCSIFLDASMRVPITAEMIEDADDLKLIVTATTGADHIDQGALEKREIPLLTLKGQKQVLRSLTPAAEQSWLLLMACARHMRSAMHHVENGNWNRTLFPGIMLKGRTIGIIGFGRLGSWMARYAAAFDMNIQVHDPFVRSFPEHVMAVEFDQLLASSDFITIHVHLTDLTKGMLNKEKLGLIKKGTIFINTSRAELVDTEALVMALEENRIAAVGVDVLTNEPEITNDLLWKYAETHKNVIISPHIGGFSPQAVKCVLSFSAKRIIEFMGTK
jgi:phosphoglycerate dehydrogenase-like enzyme